MDFGDRVLLVLIMLTTLTFSISAGGAFIGLGDLTLVPALIVIAFLLTRVGLRRTYLVPAYLYLTWCVATLFWTADLLPALVSMVQYTQFIAVTALAFSTASSTRAVRVILNGYVVATTMLSLCVLVFAAATGTYAYVFFLDYQKNLLGALTGNAIPLIIALLMSAERRRLLQLALVLNTAALIVSSSRGSMFGAIIGVLVLLILSGHARRAFLVTAAAVFSLWLYITAFQPQFTGTFTDFSPDSSAYSRVLIFNDAWEFISQRPFVGSGLHSYEIALPQIGFFQTDPSNVFLLNLAEVGIIGLVVFLLILRAIFRQVFENRRLFIGRDREMLVLSAGLAGAFASHFTHIQIDVSWVRGTGTFAFACVGLIFALARIGRTSGEGNGSGGAARHDLERAWDTASSRH